MDFSKHFSLHEFEHSSTATRHYIINKAGAREIQNLQLLVDNILEPARIKMGCPIAVTSGYRCPRLNSLPEVGGAPTSYHLQGKAADIWCKDNDRLLAILKTLPCTELIAYRRKDNGVIKWIHVAYSDGEKGKIAFSRYL